MRCPLPLRATLVCCLVLVAGVAGAAAAASGPTLAGSFWYSLDNVTRVEPEARILVWTTVPPTWHGQQVTLGNIVPEPVAVLDDTTSGNRIIEWLLEPEPFVSEPGDEPLHLLMHYDFTVAAEPIHLDPDPAAVGPYDHDAALYRRYTRAETWLQTDGLILDRAREIVAGETGALEMARRLYDWVIREIAFVPGGQGGLDAASVLEQGTGDCGQLSRLFTALCRSIGIPARTVTDVWPNGSVHVFAEVFLPGYDWVPVELALGQLMLPEGGGLDPAAAKALLAGQGIVRGEARTMFGALPDRRVVVTVGNNILVDSPTLGTWTDYRRLRPGGVGATPPAVDIRGLGPGYVQGGFFVFGEQPADEEAAHTLVHQRLADSYFREGLDDMVGDGCRKSIEAQPDGIQSWINLGKVYLHKDQYYKAEAAFLRGLQGVGGDRGAGSEAEIWIHNYLGNCYDLLGQRELAVQQYRIVLERGDNSRGAMDYARRFLGRPFVKSPPR